MVNGCDGKVWVGVADTNIYKRESVVALLIVTAVCKGYRPEARGYVIYSPRALPKLVVRSEC